ncbi:hypothetical protein [Actinomycetospora straminea]|uniref:hypothetical protein n=1 Tax=Actinomycetospora straminea TaxID=663607 RepID=UPI00236515ED|nr:hypothetical protein [Actinomycetospora straminea]MDD7932626.1 hypothetical protein [Actinomycetospora straminea]
MPEQEADSDDPDAGSADGAAVGAGTAHADDRTAETSEGWSGEGPDTGTVRRSRPSRAPRTHGVPTPPSPMNATTGPTTGPPGPTGRAPVAVPDPPRRPVPPTFASPGQPPPGVARRHGRHARPEQPGTVHTPPSGYRPRHAAPDAETEQFAATPMTGPGGVGPVPLAAPAGAPSDGVAAVGGRAVDGPPVDGTAVTADTPLASAPGGTLLHTGPGVVVPAMGDGTDTGSERVRVVLAERRVPTRAVRTVAEIEQQTETGELLLRNLLRAQLALGMRLGLVAVFVLGALPVLFLVLPRFGSFEVAGVTLPWLVLGLAPYPFMLALAWLYVRTAERNELDFADNVED